MWTVLITIVFFIQAYAKLTALFEQRMDSYANADARVSLERRFQHCYVLPEFSFWCILAFTTNNGPSSCGAFIRYSVVNPLFHSI